jgi:hypothetical protein
LTAPPIPLQKCSRWIAVSFESTNAGEKPTCLLTAKLPVWDGAH